MTFPPAAEPIAFEPTPPPRKERKPRVVNDKDTKSAPLPDEVPDYPRGGYKTSLAKMHGFLGMALAPVLPNTALAIMENAEQCAEAIDSWAKDNPNVRKVLNLMAGTGTVGALAVVYWPIVSTGIVEIREKREEARKAREDAEQSVSPAEDILVPGTNIRNEKVSKSNGTTLSKHFTASEEATESI